MLASWKHVFFCCQSEMSADVHCLLLFVRVSLNVDFFIDF
jgi:hypothetical protein